MAKTTAGSEPKSRMDAYEAVFTALAHPARRRILLTLNFEGGSMTAGDIADMFEHAWPTTTRHIQVLESAGLLRHDRQGLVAPEGQQPDGARADETEGVEVLLAALPAPVQARAGRAV